MLYNVGCLLIEWYTHSPRCQRWKERSVGAPQTSWWDSKRTLTHCFPSVFRRWPTNTTFGWLMPSWWVMLLSQKHVLSPKHNGYKDHLCFYLLMHFCLCYMILSVWIHHAGLIIFLIVVQTLCSLVRGLYRKMQGDYGFDFINILIGFDAAEEQMQLLLNHCSNFLTGKFMKMFLYHSL